MANCFKRKILYCMAPFIIVCALILSLLSIAPHTNFNNVLLFCLTGLSTPKAAGNAVLTSMQNESVFVQAQPDNTAAIQSESNNEQFIQPMPESQEQENNMPGSTQQNENSNENKQEPLIIEPYANGGTPTQGQTSPPAEIPEGMVAIIPKLYSGASGASYIQTGSGFIQNFTQLPDSFIEGYVQSELPFSIELNSEEPQVLIMHTHGTETYELENEYYTSPTYSARSTNGDINVTSIGEIITQHLNNEGINTLHDTSLHDYPSYNGSYERSHKVVSDYLAKYPSIKVVIDVHRDALQNADGTRIKPLAYINGENTAQVMIICGADLNGNLPNYTENLKFAAAWQAQMEGLYPGLTRPVLFDYRYYNQDLTTGSLLLEVGGHANTLKEAQNAAIYAAKALVQTLLGE